jgi:hypothetical protein
MRPSSCASYFQLWFNTKNLYIAGEAEGGPVPSVALQ